MTTEEIKLQTRKAKTGDIDTITGIENRQFRHPWKKHQFSGELTHDISYFYVCEDAGSKEAVGYIIFWIMEKTMELHRIAVSEKYRQKGIGKRLFMFMMETAKKKKVEEIFLEVRGSNTEAITLYESFHFRQVGVRKNYYSSPPEDALIYRLTLPPHKR
jgi:ribosomal-protein-alanine N-acetyltransferase